MDEIEFRNTSGLTITSIQLKFNTRNIDTNPIKAYAKVTFNSVLVVNGLKVVEGKFGYFVSWPSMYIEEERRGQNICYPVNKPFNEYVTDMVLKEFKNPSIENIVKM